ncbi:protease modulator HflC [Alloalcanivorax gelatiniphagus]|uniref:Protein HflC n=1 Tax=Alloalcanivorax gelatiniphagus TaxID=1194167 RepID=A0ABY2XKA3_9GAMM|nr:protease modulator HflC [Alloalcanivorax gelatiniphagus]TMW12433.1 protease modulator HflC [Alloalcanivorax gelatiniphagus]
MGTRSWLVLVAVGVLLLLALDSFYIVNETEKAVLKRFSRVEQADIEPGIYPKVPLIDEVIRVDGRLLTHDVPTQSFLTAEKKLLNVDAFVTWRIADVQRYIVSVGAGANSGQAMERRARELLDPRVNEALRNQFASRTVQEVVAGRGGALPDEALDPSAVSTGELMNGTTSAQEQTEAAQAASDEAVALTQAQPDPDAGSGPPPEKDDQREELMNSVAQEVNAATMEDLGIEVVDVRVKQVDWPEQVRGRVFDRMRAERARDAAEHRARGREVAERIRAAADRERTEILAQAYEGAQKTRGEGDARATNVYADAYSKDREFFRFYRSLQAYRDSFNSSDDLLILSPDSEFFRYMKQSEAK